MLDPLSLGVPFVGAVFDVTPIPDDTPVRCEHVGVADALAGHGDGANVITSLAMLSVDFPGNNGQAPDVESVAHLIFNDEVAGQRGNDRSHGRGSFSLVVVALQNGNSSSGMLVSFGLVLSLSRGTIDARQSSIGSHSCSSCFASNISRSLASGGNAIPYSRRPPMRPSNGLVPQSRLSTFLTPLGCR